MWRISGCDGKDASFRYTGVSPGHCRYPIAKVGWCVTVYGCGGPCAPWQAARARAWMRVFHEGEQRMGIKRQCLPSCLCARAVMCHHGGRGLPNGAVSIETRLHVWHVDHGDELKWNRY